jgi:hypothetical protein
MFPWIEVASSGSRKEDARPTATTVPTQMSRWRPGLMRMSPRGSIGWPERLLDLPLRLLGRDVGVAVDVTAAEAVLRGDLPHPAEPRAQTPLTA